MTHDELRELASRVDLGCYDCQHDANVDASKLARAVLNHLASPPHEMRVITVRNVRRGTWTFEVSGPFAKKDVRFRVMRTNGKAGDTIEVGGWEDATQIENPE